MDKHKIKKAERMIYECHAQLIAVNTYSMPRIAKQKMETIKEKLMQARLLLAQGTSAAKPPIEANQSLYLNGGKNELAGLL